MDKTEKRTITVLGSTGSVGTQSMDVIEKCGLFEVKAITAGNNAALAEEQIRRFSPDFCAMLDEEAANDLRVRVKDTQVKVLSGADGIEEAIRSAASETVINAISGLAGLKPTLAAVDSCRVLATANKESVVAAGHIVKRLADEKGVRIMPVDSEHSAIYQCLEGNSKDQVRRIILTCSGGAFLGYSKRALSKVTVRQALKHPSWNMGKKITVDCATLMNKGLELLEAVFYFGVPEDRIDVLIHPESIIHSMVEYNDSAVIAQLSEPDMRLCIQYAITYPERMPSPVVPLDLAKRGRLTFREVDNDAFPAIEIARRASRLGGLYPAVLTAADEAAVDLFINGKIRFTDIIRITEAVAFCVDKNDDPTVEDIISADEQAREQVLMFANEK
ncbi:MAG: 1-deoxy-D-xylulose-5-phosphate reductoisomerase [Clostridia bacterium]|nr:1-deoxy-D-xylulose-5-phosphate reductoisomerase [Clostridia bacterium]